MKLEHTEDLSFFYKCRTFLYKKTLNGYVRVLDLYPIFTPTFKKKSGVWSEALTRIFRILLNKTPFPLMNHWKNK